MSNLKHNYIYLMITLSYRPALDHPVYKGGYYFVLVWAALDIIMTLRHFFLYAGSTPVLFHMFVVLAILLPLFRRHVTFDSVTKKTIYHSNVPGEPRNVDFDTPTFYIERDRKIGTLIIENAGKRFNTKITEAYKPDKDKEVPLTNQGLQA